MAVRKYKILNEILMIEIYPGTNGYKFVSVFYVEIKVYKEKIP